MKRIAPLVLLLLLWPALSTAQPHKAVLRWVAPADAIPGVSTYNVYRTKNACPLMAPGAFTWTKVNSSPITALIFTDTKITVGSWCYYITQEQEGIESPPSRPVGGTVRPKEVSLSSVNVD